MGSGSEAEMGYKQISEREQLEVKEKRNFEGCEWGIKGVEIELLY